jgi:hypothetical protein
MPSTTSPPARTNYPSFTPGNLIGIDQLALRPPPGASHQDGNSTLIGLQLRNTSSVLYTTGFPQTVEINLLCAEGPHPQIAKICRTFRRIVRLTRSDCSDNSSLLHGSTATPGFSSRLLTSGSNMSYAELLCPITRDHLLRSHRHCRFAVMKALNDVPCDCIREPVHLLFRFTRPPCLCL